MNATHFEAALLAVPKAVPELRHAVRAYLGGDPHSEVELCVSELVSNVIRHVGEGTPVRVRVTRVGRGGLDDDRIRVEVTDPDPRALPVLLDATTDTGLGAESGRGLMLLDAVAVRWGCGGGQGVVVRGAGVRLPASRHRGDRLIEPTGWHVPDRLCANRSHWRPCPRARRHHQPDAGRVRRRPRAWSSSKLAIEEQHLLHKKAVILLWPCLPRFAVSFTF